MTIMCAPHHLIIAYTLNNHYYKIAKEKSSFTFPTIRLKRLSDFNEFLTFLQACKAVVWSLPPKCMPIVESDRPRSSLQRYTDICLASAISFLLLGPTISSERMFVKSATRLIISSADISAEIPSPSLSLRTFSTGSFAAGQRRRTSACTSRARSYPRKNKRPGPDAYRSQGRFGNQTWTRRAVRSLGVE